jgi:hypothetical protein
MMMSLTVLFWCHLRKLILNLMHFGYKVLNEESVKAAKSKIKSKERPGEKYETSRWTPLLQDIAEVVIKLVCVCVHVNSWTIFAILAIQVYPPPHRATHSHTHTHIH